jgi:hypothetical protein
LYGGEEPEINGAGGGELNEDRKEKHQLRIGDVFLEYEDGARGAIRWAVGSQAGRRSSTWRFWGNKKGDAYLSTRTIGGIVKGSFHKDGNCHVGFTEEYAKIIREQFPQMDSRHWHTWSLPEGQFGKLVQIVVPEFDLRENQSNEMTQTKWIEAPPAGSVLVVTLFAVNPKVPENVWLRDLSGSKPLGRMETKDRHVWAVYTDHPMSESISSLIETTRGEIAARPATADVPRGPGYRLVAFGSKGEHDPYFLDLAWD